MAAAVVLFLIFLLLFLLERLLFRRFWMKGLSANVSFLNDTLFEGQRSALIEVIRNDKWLPLPNLKVKFHVSRKLKFIDMDVNSNVTDFFYRNDMFALSSREEIKRTIPFVAAQRGYYEAKSIDLVGSDIFFMENLVETLPVYTQLTVYPKTFESEAFKKILVNLNGDIATKRALVTDPFSYIGIREYAPTDDRRLINQKASAKGGGLMVDVQGFSCDITGRIVLELMDNGVFKHHKAVESAISMTLGLAEHLSQMGVSFSFVTSGRDIKSGSAQGLSHGTGAGHIMALREILARIDEGAETDKLDFDFESAVKNELTFFISVGAYPEFVEGMRRFSAHSEDFYWFYVVQGYDEPMVPSDLKEKISFIYIDK